MRALVSGVSLKPVPFTKDSSLSQAHEEYGEGDEMLNALLESTLDLVVIADELGVVRMVSKGAVEKLGTPAEELVGFRLSDEVWASRIHQADSPTTPTGIAPLLEAARQGEFTRGLEWTIQRADGASFTLIADVVPLREENWKFGGLLIVARDTTESKQVNEQLVSGRVEFDGMLDAMPGGLGIIRMDGAIIHMNRSLRDLLGIVKAKDSPKHVDELRAIVEFAWPDGRSLNTDEWPKLFGVSGGVIPDTELRARINATGESRIFSLRSAPARDARESITHVVVNAEDITARKEAEFALQRARDLLATAHEAAHAGAFDWNIGTQHVDATPELERLYGFDPGGAGRDYAFWIQRVAPEARHTVESTLAACFESREEECVFDAPVVRRDGSRRWIYHRAGVEYDPDGRPLRMRGIQLDITARRNAEEALRESEERYRQYVELAPDAVWRWDYDPPVLLDGPEQLIAEKLTNGRVGDCNLAYAQQRGFSAPSQLIGRTIAETTWAPPSEYLSHALLFTRPGCRIPDLEYAEHSGTEMRHYAATFFVVMKDDHVQSVWGARRDVTARKLATQALARSDERLRVLLESVSIGTWTHSPETGVFESDARTRILHGLDPDPSKDARSPLDAIHPNDRARFAALFEARKPGEDTFSATVRPVLADGASRWLAYDGRYIADPADGMRRWLGVVKDVTQVKIAEEELRHHPLRFRMVAEAAQDILITSPGDLKCDYMNPRGAEYTGFSVTELRETGSWAKVIHPEDLPSFMHAISALLQTGAPSIHEVRLRRADGAFRGHRIQFVGGPTDPGGVFQCFVVATDIDDLKNMGVQLESQRNQLEHVNRKLVDSNRELQQFAATVAHALQSPLNAISLTAQRLEAAVADSQQEDAAHSLQLISASVKRMSHLVQRAFDYSRVESVVPPAFAPVDCSGPLRQALAALGAEIQSSGGSVTAGVMPVVHGDAAQIEELFQNLISNAINHRRPDRSPRVRVSASASDAGWLFDVADNGIGIPPSDAERIFKPFVRLRSDRAGAGIGLAICRKIVERHGGRIWVESNSAEGSTFYFTLPAEKEFDVAEASA